MSASIFNLSSLNGSNGFRLDGEHESDESGISVSSAGDVNGDGFADVIVGAWLADSNGDKSGSSYVVFGKASGFDAQMDLSSLDGNNGFRMDGEIDGDNLGHSVSSAGDVNGDGFDDVIVGAFAADPNGDFSGSSYVVFGKATGFDAQMDLSNLDGSNGFRLDGEHTKNMSGHAVSSAGDVNGDGFADVIVGAMFANSNGSWTGSSYVVLGKASGFDAQMNLSSLDGQNGFRLDGEHEGDRSGNSVSSAGDVNGDGFADMIVGAFQADPNGGISGSSYVVFGKASAFDAQMDLSSLDGSNGFRLDGEKVGSFSGLSVSGAGDVNGDGFGDVIIGAPGIAADDFSGYSYVVFGKATGFDAHVDLSSLDGSNGFRLRGENGRDASGESVSGAGDVNGDGFDDVIVGAHGVDSNGVNSGSSYVVFGKDTGFDARMDLSNLDGRTGLRLVGENAFDYSGGSVSGAGDVNGDGLDDLLVGAHGVSAYNNYSGVSYVIFGSRDFGNGGGELPEIKGTDGDDTLKGSETAEHFIAGEGNDNLLGRGGADVFDAGTGDDAIRIGDLTFASIDGGDGNDALHLVGTDLNLDLATLGDHIHGIETICLYGRGDNTLTLTADSLLNLSDSTNTLKVHGNSGDHIALQGTDWVDGGSYGFYHSYTHDEAVLLVGANVSVEFV